MSHYCADCDEQLDTDEIDIVERELYRTRKQTTCCSKTFFESNNFIERLYAILKNDEIPARKVFSLGCTYGFLWVSTFAALEAIETLQMFNDSTLQVAYDFTLLPILFLPFVGIYIIESNARDDDIENMSVIR
jgi:hypothetical protein